MPRKKRLVYSPRHAARRGAASFIGCLSLMVLLGAPAKVYGAPALFGSTLSASAGLVGSLGPVTYSPGTLAVLVNQVAGQLLGLLTQAVS